RLLAAGLTSVLALQTMVIVGGNLKLIPLTGVTLPFVSYGGSSLLANFLILGVLLRASHEESLHAFEHPHRESGSRFTSAFGLSSR
ncbi:MAG TPA: FtsW/RodA/SpoVE family cell cycle protein, partial [Chloroflexota bacterium]|nr:FtsW/RodA/SpoVE family cell cycle protein [Chloroflexota bacterium]